MQFHKSLLGISLMLLTSSFGCNSNQVKNSENHIADATVQQGGKITVTGEVTRVHKTDVDKTNRNPKYIVQIRMTVESIDDNGAGIKLQSPALFQSRETKVISYLGRLPKVGESLVIQSYALDKQPRLLPINGAKFATTK